MSRLTQFLKSIFLSAILCVAALPLFATVTLTVKPEASIFVSSPASISATLSRTDNVKSVDLWFYDTANSTLSATNGNHIALSSTSDAGVYGGDFPYLPVGDYIYRVEATYFDGSIDKSSEEDLEVHSYFKVTSAVTYGDALTYNRWHDNRFHHAVSQNANYIRNAAGWRQKAVGSTSANVSSNMYANIPYDTHDGTDGYQWSASGVAWALGVNWAQHKPSYRAGSSATGMENKEFGIKLPVLYFLNLGSESDPTDPDPFIRSPRLNGGVGALSFGYINLEGTSNKLLIQKAYNTIAQGEPDDNDWTTVKTLIFTEQGKANNEVVVLNDPNVTFVRIVRKTKNGVAALPNGRIVIDNIKISLPSADVKIEEVLHNPGYPSVTEDVTVRCKVWNKDDTLPAFARRLTAYYCEGDDAAMAVPNWSSTNMVLEKIDGAYEYYKATLPKTSKKYMHYYFRCDFEGHYVQPEQIIGYDNNVAQDDYDDSKPLFGTEYYKNHVTTIAPPSSTEDDHCNYSIRNFKSRYSTVKLRHYKGDGTRVDYDMDLVGDNEWQKVAPVVENTRAGAHFIGYQGYIVGEDDYRSAEFYYGDNDQAYSEDPDTGTIIYETPTGGKPERVIGTTNELTQIAVDVAKSGFLLYRLNDAPENQDVELSYTIKRGFYQDFNTWQTTESIYGKSNTGGDIQEHTTGFESWEDLGDWTTEEDETKRMNFDDGIEEGELSTDVGDIMPDRDNEFIDNENWGYYGARFVAERGTGSTNGVGQRVANKVMHLISENGLLYNTDYAVPNGLKEASLRLRSSVPGHGRHIALYDTSKYLPKNDGSADVTVEMTFSLPEAARSSSKYYAGIVFNYQDEYNYHMFRFMRWDSQENGRDREFGMQLVRVVEGVENVYQRTNTRNNNFNENNDITLKVVYRRQSNTQRLYSWVTVKIGSYTAWNGTAWHDNTNSELSLKGGKVGITAFDCAPRIKTFKVSGGESGGSGTWAKTYSADGFSSTIDEWELGQRDYSDYENESRTKDKEKRYDWYLNTAGQLERRVPGNIVNFYLTPVDNYLDENGLPDQPAWSKYSLVFAVTNPPLAFTEYTIPVRSAKDQYFAIGVNDKTSNKIKNDERSLRYVVVDDIVLTPWRAGSRTEELKFASVTEDGVAVASYDWTTSEEQYDWWEYNSISPNWHILEGFAMQVANGATADGVSGVAARFQPSQSYPGLVQGMLSPELENGAGLIKFNYRVEAGVNNLPADAQIVYTIQYSQENLSDAWADIEDEFNPTTFTNKVGDSGIRSYDLNTHYDESSMRVRVKIIPEQSHPDIVLWIDNLYVNDHIEDSDEMWVVYNGRITSTDKVGDTAAPGDDETRIYEGRSLYLNNSFTEGVDEGFASMGGLQDDMPHLMAPKMDEGIGEIAFMYRAYDPAKQSTIIIEASETGAGGVWQPLTNIVVTSSSYIKFSNPKIYYTEYKFVRIRTEIDDVSGRACIDNFLVTEPSRPGYEIYEIALSPSQPILGDDTLTISAKIGKELQNPKGIRLFASFYTGTNVWGHQNWWRGGLPSASNTTTIELNRQDDTSTFVGKGLPSTPANGVIQYIVWGVHNDISPDEYTNIHRVILQERETFKNPSHYGTLDYNKQYGSDESWSPYYIIFSCAPGAVWINEAFLHRSSGTGDPGWYMGDGIDSSTGDPLIDEEKNPAYEFIELAGKAGTDISGWVINEWGGTTPNKLKTFTIPDGTTIPDDGDGWGFYVIGEVGTPNADYIIGGSDTPNVNYVLDEEPVPADRDVFTQSTTMLEFTRAGGIIEQRILISGSMGSNYKKIDPLPIFVEKRSSSYYGLAYALVDNKNEDLPSDLDASFTTSVNNMTWWWTYGIPTPGLVNKDIELNMIGQNFAEVLLDGYAIISKIAINGGGRYGTQDGSIADITINVPNGESPSTNIVYLANDWYRILSLTKNEVEIPAAKGKREYNLDCSDVTAATNFEVTFAPAEEIAGAADIDSSYSASMLTWFRENSWSEEAIKAGDGDEYSLQEEYLLNTSPTLHTTVDMRATAFALGTIGNNPKADITLRLSRIEDGIEITEADGGNRGVNGAVRIYAKVSLDDPEWTKLDMGQNPGMGFKNSTDKKFSIYAAKLLDYKFFTWKIEEEAEE